VSERPYGGTVPSKHSGFAAYCQDLSDSDRFQRKVQHMESTIDANAMMNGGHLRHGTGSTGAKAKSFSKHGNHPADVQQIDELARALEGLGEIETIVKAYERVSRT
jgi:hypothetical protein